LNQSVPIVLVVEDDDAIQTIAEDVLVDAGFEAAIVPSGEEALTLFVGPRRDGYRAVVTDIKLRGSMDGWEVAQRVREIHPEFPVVYMSGVSAAEWPSKGVPNSIMLAKPFAPAQLVTAVSQLLNKSAPTT
jgi:DNA-binding response OmpR family regulator